MTITIGLCFLFRSSSAYSCSSQYYPITTHASLSRAFLALWAGEYVDALHDHLWWNQLGRDLQTLDRCSGECGDVEDDVERSCVFGSCGWDRECWAVRFA